MRVLAIGALALVAIPVILLSTSTARAADPAEPRPMLEGQPLHERCAGPPGVCQGYVGAVIDVERLHSTLAGREPLYCVPETERLPDLVDRVTSWLAARPHQAGRSAVAQVTVALMDTFPCAHQAPASPDPNLGR